ncbi:MAG TPA: carboxypeptidase-like regulatory domain-containing protein [Terriglobales bacterium]|nr:carboxypeptidase-like regulatory domain-containing protein [Terriglobales bacterium]
MPMRISGLIMIAVAAVLAVVPAAAEKQYSDLSFRVVKKANGKPIRNASVILHLVNKEGKQERGGFQVKTDREGKANFPGAPYGKLRIQVLASGFQTFGEDFDINQPTHEFTFEMNPPQKQHSIYDQAEEKKEDKKPEEKEEAQKSAPQ